MLGAYAQVLPDDVHVSSYVTAIYGGSPSRWLIESTQHRPMNVCTVAYGYAQVPKKLSAINF